MNTSLEFYARLQDYLVGRARLRDLEGWLAPRFEIIASAPDSDLSQDAATTELCISEVQCGLRTERSAKAFLRKHFARRVQTTYTEYTENARDRVVAESGSSSTYQEMASLVPVQWLDEYTQLGEVFA